MTATIIHGDCLDVLRGMADASVDAVVTDPPYGISYQSTRKTADRRLKMVANDGQPFVWWLHDAARVMRVGAPMLCFCRWDVAEAFRQAITWAGLKVVTQVIWDRGLHGMADLKTHPAPRHDVIWFATKGRCEFPGRRPMSVVTHQRVSGSSLVHPTEKPEPLMRDLIQSYVPPGGTILDPFAGSGTTLVAALAEGRQAIGIEREAEYVEIVKARLAKAEAA